VEKLANSPIGAEALTRADQTIRYGDPQTSISGSSFSTGQAISQDTPEAGESINTAEQPGSSQKTISRMLGERYNQKRS